MKVLGILGSHRRDGVTAKLVDAVLQGVDPANKTEIIYLEDYGFKPDTYERKDPVLDELEGKLLESDVWIIAAPTYWRSLAGKMKDFFDCLRQRLVRFDKQGETHPDRFKNKHYLSITDCYTGTFENWVTGVTDQSLRTIDQVMSAAGVIKVNEIVMTNTWGIQELPAAKKSECLKRGQQLSSVQKRDDSTVKRYIQLFFMVAIMALAAMGIQLGLGLLPKTHFWLSYSSFVVIFFALLAGILHFATYVKHRRK